MLNKVNNNISFKGVYFFPNINNMSDENKAKAGAFAKVAKQAFPQNDIFLASDNTGELYMRVHKANPLRLLLDQEIAAMMGMTTIQLAELINLVIAYKSAHDELWGKEDPYVVDKTENINDMDAMDISFQFCRIIDLFNKTHRDIAN